MSVSSQSLSPDESDRDRRVLAGLLRPAGVALDGPDPWDIQVLDSRMCRRILAHGSLGAGESYMDGWWECSRLDEMLTRVFVAGVEKQLRSVEQLLTALRARVLNPQAPRRAFKVGEKHYDIGDDLFTRMLDRRMIYSCAYWRQAQTLDEAQEAKLDLVCRKLGFQPGMRVLDIGCGWGGAAQFAAQRYGVEVTGITVSAAQAATARERCAGLPVKIVLDDYRRLEPPERFDRVYSLGMFEHVGLRNYRRYFGKVRELLAPDGLFLLHTIGSNVSVESNDPWVERYIFPNSMLPSLAQVTAAAEPDWVMEDWQGFGVDYDRTLICWHRNFERHWPEIEARYGERFRRMWRFWLLSSAASFRSRRLQLWQFVFSPQGVPGGYREVR